MADQLKFLETDKVGLNVWGIVVIRIIIIYTYLYKNVRKLNIVRCTMKWKSRRNQKT